MARLIVIRHAEALKNHTSFFGGADELDTLTGNGRTAARRQEGVLAKEPFDGFIVSSPAGHARETARLLAGPATPVRTEARIGPISPGSVGGKSQSVAEALAPSMVRDLSWYRQGLFNGYNLDFPDGETVVEFEQRVLSWLDDTRACTSTDICIVTHRSVITALAIHFARLVFAYPNDFYGYVDVPLLGGLIIDDFRGSPRFDVVQALFDGDGLIDA